MSNRYDDQWADVIAAEQAAAFRHQIDAWQAAYRAASFFHGVRGARVVGGAA